MDPIAIIRKYYPENSSLYNILLDHSIDVSNKALKIATNHPELNIDTVFLQEAGMLHDVGIFLTDAPSIECRGKFPYICHGYLGHNLLVKEGLPKQALVSERHTGTGLLLAEIIDQKLPLPHREMIPISIEEQLICFADCFYSKTDLGKEKSIEKIKKSLTKYGERSLIQFDYWCNLFAD